MAIDNENGEIEYFDVPYLQTKRIVAHTNCHKVLVDFYDASRKCWFFGGF